MRGTGQMKGYFVIVLALATAGFAGADECLYETRSWPFGPISSVAAADGFAFHGSGTALVVTDLADPRRPEIVAHRVMPALIEEIVVAGDRAYVAAGDQGLVVVDVSTPTLPAVVSTIYFSGPVRTVSASDTVAVVLAGWAIWLVDLSTPGGPHRPVLLMGNSALGPLGGPVAVTSSHAFVALRSGGDYEHPGIAVFDLAIPSQPRFVTRFDLPLNDPQTIIQIEADSDTLYVTENDGLRLIDVTVPEAPVAAGRLTLQGASRLTVSGDFAYVVCGCELRIVDVSTRTAPDPRGSFPLQDAVNILDVAVSGEVALLADDRPQLTVTDVSDPSAPQQWASLTVPGATTQVVVSQGLAYLVEEGRGLRVVDLSGVSAPTYSALDPTLFTPYPASHLVVEDPRAYLATATSLVVFDVSAPEPLELGRLTEFLDAAPVLAVDGDRAYITSDHYGLAVVDISDASSMSVLGYGGIETAASIVVEAGIAYVGGHDQDGPGLYILDVSDPSAIAKLGFVESRLCSSFICFLPRVSAMAGGRLALIGMDSVTILDISDPITPLEIGVLAIPFVWDIAVSESLVYAAAGEQGVFVIDISDPANPVYVGHLDTAGEAWGVGLEGRLVAVAQGDAGMSAFRYTQCASQVAPESSTW